MASSSRALALNRSATRQFGVARLQQQQHAVTSRLLTPTARSLTSASSKQPLNARIRPVVRQFQRQYSDAPSPPPKKSPGKLRKTLRWTWRLMYLSVLGSLAYVAYDVYDDRHPEQQVAPDPNKKTLVILGKLLLPLISPIDSMASL